MKSLFLRLGFFILISFSFGCKKQKDHFEDVLIEVGSAKLDGFEFSKLLVRKFTEQGIRYPKPEIITVLKRQILEDFIIQSLYESYARKKNLLVKKELLDKDFQKLIDSYPDNEGFEVFISESGLNKSDVKESLREKILRRLVREDLFSSQTFEVTDKEINTYYEKNKSDFSLAKRFRAKHIMVENEEDGIKIKDLLKQAREKNFESLAQKYSLSPEKENGGDLGWLNVDDYPAFETAVKTSKGQITPIIKSENGYHIFKIIDIKAPETTKLASVKSDIKNILIKEKQEVFISEWIKESTKKVKIKINDDLLGKIVVNRPNTF